MIKKPNYFSFTITERCQSHCTTCNGWRTPYDRIKYELSTEDWKFLLFEMKNWLGSFDFIFSGGEPFVREDIFEIADYARSIGLNPKVISNGLGLKNKCEQLINSGFSEITISLNSITNPEIHNISRGRKDAFKITTDVIQNLAYLNRKLNKPKKLTITSIIMPSNLTELEPLSIFANKNGIGICFQLIDGGDSFFDAGNIAQEFNKMLDEMKDDAIKAIDRLKYLKTQGHIIYNTDEQLEGFKEVLINSAQKNTPASGENIIPIFAREGYNYSDTVSEDKINKCDLYQREVSDYISPQEYTTTDGCKVGYRNFSIDPYGGVRICLSMPPVGSLKDDLPENIWNSEEADLLREKIMNCNKSCKLLNCNFD